MARRKSIPLNSSRLSRAPGKRATGSFLLCLEVSFRLSDAGHSYSRQS